MPPEGKPKFQPPSDAELQNRFKHHAPPLNSDLPARYGVVRNSLLVAVKVCRDVSPVSPEQTRAINKVEDAMFLFNAAIARAPADVLTDLDAALRQGGTRFRKKPVVIDAFKWTGDEKQIHDPTWAVDAIKSGGIRFVNPGTPKVSMFVMTDRGEVEANRGDWIVKGVSGEIYPVPMPVFVSTYEVDIPA